MGWIMDGHGTLEGQGGWVSYTQQEVEADDVDASLSSDATDTTDLEDEELDRLKLKR